MYVLDLRNLQEQVKKAFCYQKLFWPFTIWIDCSSDLKTLANSWPSASNFKSFFPSLDQFFLTVGQNNFGNKIPLYFSLGNSTIDIPIFSVQRWLERTPGLNEEGFNFPQKFKEAVEAIFDKEWQRVQVISKNANKIVSNSLYCKNATIYQISSIINF